MQQFVMTINNRNNKGIPLDYFVFNDFKGLYLRQVTCKVAYFSLACLLFSDTFLHLSTDSSLKYWVPYQSQQKVIIENKIIVWGVFVKTSQIGPGR